MKNKGVKLLAMAMISATIMISSIMQVKAADDTYICQEYQKYIYQISDKYKIHPEIIMAIIERESSGKANAIDDSGNCHGLMQINISSHKDRMRRLGVTDIYDPYSNILVGVDYLSEIMEGEDNVYNSLMVYHGESNIEQKIKNGKTSRYAISIIDRASELMQLHK